MTNAAAEDSRTGSAPAIGRRELEAAHEIARAFLATTQPIEVYRLALSRLMPVVRADFAAVFLRDESDPEILRPVCVHGWPQSSARYLGQLRIRVGLGPTGQAVAANAPVEVSDVFADPSLTDWWDPARELGFASLITVPLATHLGVNGAVSFYFAEPRIFSEDERRLLRLISEHLAATTLRARIVEELRAENERLRAKVETLLEANAQAKTRSRTQDQLTANVLRDVTRALDSLDGAGGTHDSGDPFVIESVRRTIAELADLADLRLGRARLATSPEDAVRIARLAVEAAGPSRPGATFELETSDTIIPVTTDAPATVRALATLLTHTFARTARGHVRLSVAQVEAQHGMRVEWILNARGIGLGGDAAGDAGATLEMTLADEVVTTLGGSITGSTDAGDGYTLRLSLPSRRA